MNETITEPTPDINELQLRNEMMPEVDGTVQPEDFFAPPLPDDGEHQAVLRLGDRSTKIKRQKDKETQQPTGNAFVEAHVMAKILDDAGVETITVFDNPNSVVMQSSRTSRLHMVLRAAGFELPERPSFGEFEEFTKVALDQTPHVTITTQWQAQVNRGTKEKPVYKDVLTGQKNFKKILDADGNWTGKYDPEVMDPESHQKVRAIARIVRYGIAVD